MSLEADLFAQARAAWPRECCGLIVQTAAGLALRPATNRAAGLHRFDLDPAALIQARRAGTPLVAFYHSHCGAPPTPSAADRAFARGWPGVAQVIVAVFADRPGRIAVALPASSEIERADDSTRELHDRSHDGGLCTLAEHPEPDGPGLDRLLGRR